MSGSDSASRRAMHSNSASRVTGSRCDRYGDDALRSFVASSGWITLSILPKSGGGHEPYVRSTCSRPRALTMPEALVDTNVLLCFLTDEPRERADRVEAILEAAERLRVDLVVASPILAE